jgi:hypothetical protein
VRDPSATSPSIVTQGPGDPGHLGVTGAGDHGTPSGPGRAARRRRSVRRVVVATALLGGTALGVNWRPLPSGADSTGAGAGGGTVSVGAGSGSGGAGAGGSQGSSGGAPAGGGGSGASPWSCTYTYLALNNEGGFAPGGTLPGAWYSVTCVDAATVEQVTQTVWVTGAAPAGTAPVDPRSLALQAENSIDLPKPALHLDPSGTAVVDLSTWYWIDPAIWRVQSVTATAGSVSATAVARPVDVRWTSGDGGQVVCNGPGVAYIPWLPSAWQSTACSYDYAQTSAGQPTLDGNPDDGTYVVTATVDWAVTWTSTGAAGGGALPALVTTDAALLRVIQVESVNATAVAPVGRPSAARSAGA